MRAEYRSDRFRSPGGNSTTRAAKEALGDYKGYSLLHVGGSYKVSRQLNFNAAIYNLLNKNFIDYQAYSASATAPVNYGNRYVNSQEGRRLWVSANYDF